MEPRMDCVSFFSASLPQHLRDRNFYQLSEAGKTGKSDIHLSNLSLYLIFFSEKAFQAHKKNLSN